MSDQTFEQLWKRLVLYNPELPITLAQEFVNTAYSRALSSWSWSHLRKWKSVVVKDSYSTGTVTATNASTTVTGSGTTFASTMVGMQIMFASEPPIYQITAVSPPTGLTIYPAYEGTTGSGKAYTICQVYLDMPSDFDYIEDVVDTTTEKRLHTRFTQEDINLFDPSRKSSGSPMLAAYSMPFDDSTTQIDNRLEIWPRPANGEKLIYYYRVAIPLMTAASDLPIPPLRGDILREGSFAEMCLYPGFKDSPNPMYDLNAHQIREQRFKDLLQEAQVSDRERIQQFKYAEVSKLDYAPLDANFIQSHGGIWF